MSPFLITSVASIIADFCLGAFLLLRPKKKLLNYIFTGFVWALSLWTFGDIVFLLPAFSSSNPDIYVSLSTIGAIFTVPFFVHFIFLFSKTRFPIWLAIFLYGIAGLLSLATVFTTLFIQSVSFQDTLKIGYGPLYIIFPTLIIVFLVVCYWILIRTFIKSTNPLKEQIKYVFLATIIIAFGVISYFPAIYFDINHDYRIDNIFQAIFPTIIAYAITKHELMDIKVILNKTVSFILALIVFATCYFVLVFWPYYTWISHSISFEFLLLSIIGFGGFGFGLYFHKLQRFIQTSATKKFLKLDYNLDKALQDASSALVYADTETDVLDVIFSLQINLDIGASFALIRNPKSNVFDLFHINHVESKSGEATSISTEILSLSLNHPLIKAFQNHTASVTLFSQLPAQHKNLFSSFSIHPKSIILTVHSFRQLQAIFIMGHKLSEDNYTNQDKALFDVVVNQAVIIFERITRTRELADKQTQLQDINVRQMKTLDDLRQAQLKITEFGQRYQRLAERYKPSEKE